MAIRNFISILSQELFKITLVTYLILISWEIYQAGSVSNFFNRNYLLITILLLGLMAIAGNPTILELQEFKQKRAALIKKGTQQIRRIPQTIKTLDITLIRKIRK